MNTIYIYIYIYIYYIYKYIKNSRKFLNKNKQGMLFWPKFLGSGKTGNFDFFSANLPKSGVESGF